MRNYSSSLGIQVGLIDTDDLSELDAAIDARLCTVIAALIYNASSVSWTKLAQFLTSGSAGWCRTMQAAARDCQGSGAAISVSASFAWRSLCAAALEKVTHCHLNNQLWAADLMGETFGIPLCKRIDGQFSQWT